MGYYINIKCSNCNYSLTGGYRKSGIKSNLGIPYVRCPNCETLNKTGKKPWSDMNPDEKRTYVRSRVFQSIINGFGITGLFLIIIAVLFSTDEINSALADGVGTKLIIIMILVGQLIGGVITYYNSKFMIEKIELDNRNKNYSSISI